VQANVWDRLVFLVEWAWVRLGRAWVRLERVQGRLSVYWEPRDVWVGVYVADRAVYVCPLPTLVVRWRRAVSAETVLRWGSSGDE
jgi:hypothetical protein